MGLHGQVNLLLLNPADFTAPDRVVISDRRFCQLKEVIKPEAGDTIRTGLCGGLVGEATLLTMNEKSAELQVSLDHEPPPPSRIELICALPRPQTFRKVLHCALTMGVKKIRFIHAKKVEKSYWQSSMLSEKELDEEIRLALEQCGDTVFPEIECFSRFKPFVEDILPELVQDSALFLFGHPRAKTALPAPPETGKIQLLVGPEGGFTDYETEKLAAAGALAVTLGPRVLRTEFAVAALLAKLS